jgi:choline-sulfatase
MERMSRREFHKRMALGVGAAATTLSPAVSKAQSRKRPNIVFICSDQHSYKYTGYNGHPFVETPNLDKLAKQGVVFENNYCGNPVCTPSRASMMTGVYASDTGSYCNSTVWTNQHPTWANLLSESGYKCWATGKFDLHDKYDIGFEQIDTTHGHAHNPDITSLFRLPPIARYNERPQIDGSSREEPHHDLHLLQNAQMFLSEQAVNLDKPWALYVGFSQPHPDFRAQKKYFDRYYPNRVDMPNVPPGHVENLHYVFQQLRHFKRIATPIEEKKIRRARAGYYGMITELDDYVGQLWDTLEQTGQLDNTIFIYTSDHGETLGEHGLWLKNNLYDVAARVPLIIAGPGIPQGVRVSTATAHVDLMATLLEWANVRQPGYLRGRSLTPLMQGKQGDHPGFAFCETHSEGNATGSFMIRKGDWKYIHFSFYDDLLFNVKEDPYEFDNRIDDPEVEDIKLELQELLNQQVDPKAVTMAAFEKQKKMRDEFVRTLDEQGLVDLLKGRLGEGQSRALAHGLKRGLL